MFELAIIEYDQDIDISAFMQMLRFIVETYIPQQSERANLNRQSL